jgi:hypothetical protein
MKRWVALLLWVGAGVGVAAGQARLGPYVVDSNGLKVGHVDSGANAILMFVDGIPTLVSAGPSGFKTLPFNLYFTDGACGSQAYLFVGIADLFYSAGAYTTDGVIHFVNAAATSTVGTNSLILVNADGSLNACEALTTSQLLAPALAVPVSFIPPFAVVDTLPVSPAPATATFNDVPTTDGAFRFIEALAKSGITSGCQTSPPLYCPDKQITRREMAVFLAVALGL